MTKMLVHGVPDTFRIWDDVRKHLTSTDVVALALPGFDATLPPGFSATKEEYVDWIIAEIEKTGSPVDLVGHDWGCIMVARVASLRPDLIRTWAAGSGPVSASYEWHPWAEIWQTDGEGEKWMADLKPDEFATTLQEFGVPVDKAIETAGHMDVTLKDCILRLYRSAVHVGAEWEPGLAEVTSPGLVFWGVDDPACPIEFGDQMATATKAELLRLNCGHWTLVQRPQEIAVALEVFWAKG
jgi:pimeloyl-ACP methyl ester carboxylesterase